MRHKFPFHDIPDRACGTAVGCLRRACLFTVSAILAACSSVGAVKDDSLRYDFFYTPEGIRIIGQARMPAGGIDLSYQEKRDRCQALAKRHADSKWLGATEKTIELQTLWLDRLNRGARGPWQKCLDEAKILRFMPESVDSCSVVVLYSCDPQKW